MSPPLLLCALLALGATSARAQEGYEASPGLLPVGGILLFYDTQGPLSSRTMTLRELPPGATRLGEVRGRACQNGLSLPLDLSLRALSVSGAMGNGGYQKALEAVRRARPELSGLYDVRVDMRVQSVLGIFRRACVELLARGFKQPA